MLRNWFLGFFATAIWMINYGLYFARDIAAWWDRRRVRRVRRVLREEAAQDGPLAPPERHRFPPPEPPPHPVQDAEILPFPSERRRPPR